VFDIPVVLGLTDSKSIFVPGNIYEKQLKCKKPDDYFSVLVFRCQGAKTRGKD
jgi:hypothetical protein